MEQKPQHIIFFFGTETRLRWSGIMAAKSVEMKEMKNGEVVDEEDGPVHVVPPDGGWGWVVMIASFLCNIVVDGIIFSFGLIVSELADKFEVPITEVSWVASLLAGFYLLAGPFVSAIANRFGFRTVACTGSVIAGASLAIASTVNSVALLYLFVGVIGGIGFGLIYVPAVIAVGFYFEKKRALATGIAVCGSGIGTFVLAPFTTWLLSYYGWRGTLLIHAGLVLNCGIFGAMFRPLEPVKKARRRSVVGQEAGTPLMVRIKRARDQELRETDESEQNDGQADFKSSTNSVNNVKLVGIKAKRASLLTDSAGSLGVNKKPDPKEVPLLAGSKRSLASRGEAPNALNRDDAFYTGSLQRLPQYRQDPANYHASVTRIPAAADEADGQKAASSRCTLIDFSLFKSLTFDLLCLSSFITFLGFFVPFMYVAARAEQLGADKESASFLLSIIGIMNTIGRVACGALSDHPKVNALLVNNIALTVGGLVTILSPFFSSYEMLVVYACIFGLSIACFASLRSILQVELLGLENLTNAFGLCLLFTGISATFGGPLAGMFFEATNSYDAAFYLSGSLILVSGILSYPLGYLNRWEKRRQSGIQHKPKINPVADPTPVSVA